jgi:hypothetical protein
LPSTPLISPFAPPIPGGLLDKPVEDIVDNVFEIGEGAINSIS